MFEIRSVISYKIIPLQYPNEGYYIFESLATCYFKSLLAVYCTIQIDLVSHPSLQYAE